MRLRPALLVCAFACSLTAQVTGDSSLSWRPIGGTAIAADLAGPATGAVREVWFEGSGRLLARTESGRVFETSDFEHWRLNRGAASPGASLRVAADRQYFASRENIYASDDSGATWINLTGFNNRSVIGEEFASIAVSPADPRQIAAANRHGVWRSLDGGLSWHGLNTDLPNLQVRKLIGRRAAVLADGSLAAVEGGAWLRHDGADPDLEWVAELARRSRQRITAAGRSGVNIYGALSDGRVATSRDAGSTWSVAGTALGVAGNRVWTSAARPESALIAVGTRLLRTVNGGLFWDDVTGSLAATIIHGIAADATAGVVYLATDRGVYAGTVSVNDAGPVTPDWKLVSRDLPASPAWDVRLNSDHTLTVALDGYGLFETAAPHRARQVRVVNGADMSERAAAPGSLITVVGANIRIARIGSLRYPVIAAADDNSQLQVPFESGSGVFQIALDGVADKWSVPVTVKNASPAIFVDSEGAPLLLDSGSGLVLDSKLALRGGATVQMLATGLGRVTPDWPSGVAAPLEGTPAVQAKVTAFLDGTPAEVTQATLAPGYVGYYIVELRIPKIVNRGANELRIVIDGEESNRVRLYLEP